MSTLLSYRVCVAGLFGIFVIASIVSSYSADIGFFANIFVEFAESYGILTGSCRVVSICCLCSIEMFFFCYLISTTSGRIIVMYCSCKCFCYCRWAVLAGHGSFSGPPFVCFWLWDC